MVLSRSSPRIPCELILYDYDVPEIGESWADLATFLQIVSRVFPNPDP